MAAIAGWFPDPAGRYSHRWWDGYEWTARVVIGARVLTDATPVGAIAAGKRLYCGVCHLGQANAGWEARCRRCGYALTRGYVASRPREKQADVLRAAQETFDAALLAADAAFSERNFEASIRHLDVAARCGTLVRAMGEPAAPPLDLAMLVEVHTQAIRLMTRCASSLTPAAFEYELLRRFAMMYSPDRREDLPGTVPELVAWCATRVAWAEAELPAMNGLLADYSSSFDWLSIRHELIRHGYEFGVMRDTGPARDQAAALLGIEPTAGPTEIKKAYYRAASQYHPDVLGDVPIHLREEAEEKMKEINAAYAVLSG